MATVRRQRLGSVTGERRDSDSGFRRAWWLVLAAQFVAAAASVGLVAFGDAPESFSAADWASLLVPPLVFGVLFWLGLLLTSLYRNSVWRLLLGRLGCLVMMCGLVVTLLWLPIGLFGSWMDFMVG